MSETAIGIRLSSRRARLVRNVGAVGIATLVGAFALSGCSAGDASSSSGSAIDSALEVSFSSSVDEEAQQAFRASAEALLARNARLESAIAKVQDLVDTNPSGASDKVLAKARSAIKTAQKAEHHVPDVALSSAAVQGQATAMNNVTYETQMDKLLASMDQLQEGARQQWEQDNPSSATSAESVTVQSEQSTSSSASASSSSSSASTETILTAKQVAQRIKRVKHVSSTKAATKKNDPNGLLGKKNGYTAAVFFTSDLVDHDDVYGTGILTEGTDGGGCIEVYATKKKAQARNKYLAKFDGKKISSGSHKVVGTCVVRTSSLLSSSQQKALTRQLTKALTQTN